MQNVSFGWGQYAGGTPTQTDTHEYVLPAVSELLPAPPARILDIGCGNGAVTAYLTGRGYTMVGIDPDAEGIEIASGIEGPRFVVERAENGLLSRLGEDPFDAIVSTEVVEHMYNPAEWAGSCHECLRPGGLLVCSAPYHGYLKNLALAVTGRFDTHFDALRTGGHIKFFSRATLTTLLEENGFDVVAFVPRGRLPFLWKSMVVCAVRA